MRRQLHLLNADRVSRHVGMLLMSVLAAFILPFWVVFFCYLAMVFSDIAQTRLLSGFATDPTRLRHLLFLAASALGASFFLLPASIVWRMDDPLLKFAATLAVVGILLNASVVRSAHVPAGIAAGAPAALLALWMPLSDMGESASALSGGVALAGAIALIGYFLSALMQNNRAQHDLAEAARDARAASQAKSRFLAAMNHEVRTPLNALLGHSQLLRDAGSLGDAQIHAAAIERATHRLETLVEDVVDLSAAAEGQLRFTPATVTIPTEVERIASQIAASNAAPEIRINTEIAPEVPEFGRLDPVLLRKSLTHLAVIALSERPAGHHSDLNIRCALAPGRQDRLRFTLAGVARPAAAGSASAPHRVEGLEGGTIGMSFVNSIAAVMGANSAVLRAPDKTLVARIELPFIPVAEPPLTGAENVYGRLRTLVVDDIASNRLIVSQMLRSLRIEATEAASGPEAIDRLGEGEFDLVLLDMNMPDMDGEATLHSIRASGQPWAGLPVVALTADTLGSKRDHYLGLGLNGFLTKPIDRRVLWSEILSACPPPPPL